MRRSPGTAATLALVLLGVTVAGCLEGSSGRQFNPISAPLWEPGYSWTYGVTESGYSNSKEFGLYDSSESSSVLATVTVINTTAEAWGQPAYFVSLDERLDHPLFSGTYQAYSASDLRLLGRSYNDYRPKPPPETYLERGPDGIVRKVTIPYHDPCGNVPDLYTVDGAEEFPVFRFPLEYGDTAQGVVGDVSEFALRYAGRIHGLVDVQVPAGKFRAVYMTYEFAPEVPAGFDEEFGGFQLRIKAEHWYSPDVRNYVKSTLVAAGEAPDFYDEVPGNTIKFGYSSTIDLRAYGLTPGDDQPAPRAQQAGKAEPMMPFAGYQVVSDVAFPVNVAEGAVRAQFALDERSGYYGKYGFDEPPAALDLSTIAEPDPSRFRVRWFVWTMDDPYHYELAGSIGARLDFEFARGGYYGIRATLEPLTCGDPKTFEASSAVSTYWEKKFTVDNQLGLGRTFQVGKVPVELGGRTRASWEMYSDDLMPNIDRGKPEMVTPSGKVVAPAYGTSKNLDFGYLEPGSNILNWNTEGTAVGNNARLTLRVDYGTSYAMS